MKTQKLNNIIDKILNISGFILILSFILSLFGLGKIFFPIMWITLFLILISSNIKCVIDKEYRKKIEESQQYDTIKLNGITHKERSMLDPLNPLNRYSIKNYRHRTLLDPLNPANPNSIKNSNIKHK